MDVLVMLDESPERGPPAVPAPFARPMAHVNSVPPVTPFDGLPREVVTLYGAVSPEVLAFALAAAVEGQRAGVDQLGAIRHLNVWAERGAVGDAAWRDQRTGQLMTEDLDIPFETLSETARRLLGECGSLIRQMVAGLLMPDWPEGVRRAISFTVAPAMLPAALGPSIVGGFGSDALLLDSLREADGYDVEGD
jgi:hypothetical protein